MKILQLFYTFHHFFFGIHPTFYNTSWNQWWIGTLKLYWSEWREKRNVVNSKCKGFEWHSDWNIPTLSLRLSHSLCVFPFVVILCLCLPALPSPAPPPFLLTTTSSSTPSQLPFSCDRQTTASMHASKQATARNSPWTEQRRATLCSHTNTRKLWGGPSE